MNKKTRIRIWIIIVITYVMCFSDWSFAASGDDARVFGSLARTLDVCVSILSWIWILFAKIAGELLTNSWVYGSVIWLDALLWKYRNIMKNIANFWLWFYFVYVILKAVIGKEDITKKIKDIILWILVAWIWIQASRFLTAVVIDVSTITLVAAGSFPSQVISQNKTFQEKFEAPIDDMLNSWQTKRMDLFPNKAGANKLLDIQNVSREHKSKKELYDSLMPNADTISWPLYYMWVAILDTYRVPSVDSSDQWVKKTILNLIIQGWTTIVYSLEMLVLCVLAFMRILYLWMFIVLSPIAIFFWCIEASWDKDLSGISFVKTLMEQINLKTFFINVFKPTIMVIWIGLSMIFITMVNGIIDKNGNNSHQELDLGWVSIKSVMDDNTEWDETYRTSITTTMGDSYEISHVWKWILDFILSIVTIMLVYYVIDIAVKMWKWTDFVSKRVAWIHKGLWELITKTPLIPVPAYDKNGAKVQSYLSYNALKSFPEKLINNEIGKSEKKVSEQSESVMEMWWFSDGGAVLTEVQKVNIKQAWSWDDSKWMKSLIAKRDYIQSISTEQWRWMKLNPTVSDKFWIQEFEKWLEKSKWESFQGETYWDTWKRMVDYWNNPWNEETRTLEEMFKIDWAVRAYAGFFFKDDSRKNIDSWDRLKDEDISETKEESE